MVFTLNFDIGLIACLNIINRAFIFEIKGVAVEGSSGGIIQDSLIRDIDIEDRAKDEGSLSCT